MKRLINARLPVIAACVLAAGIYLGYLFKINDMDFIWLFAVIPPGAIIFIVFAAVKKSFKPLIFIIIIFIFGLFGAFSCFFRIKNYQKSEIAENVNYEICGNVYEKGKTEYGEYIILNNLRADGEKLSGEMRVYLGETYGEFCDVGYAVKFTAKLNKYDAFSYGKLNYNAEENIKYYCSVNSGLVSSYRFSLLGAIRKRIRETLFDNLDADTAAICYAMLTGNTDNVEESAMDSFRFGGIAHIFAVSGLHIGIVFTIISFICRKLHANKYVTATISVAMIVFYAGICGFTLSSVRAVIMCAISILSKLFYVKNDSLNSLAVAAALILCITPLSLFSVGFQLSICSVGGICLIPQQIKRILGRIKIPDKISSAIGVSVGAQAGTLPVMTANFGYVSGAGLILNIFIVPALSALFVLIFVCTCISAIIPAAAKFLIPFAGLPLQAILSFLINAGFERALISAGGAEFFAPLFFLGIILFSDKINFKKAAKAIAVGCTFIALGGFLLLENFFPFNGCKIIVSGYYNSGEVIFKSAQGNVLVVTENVSGERLTTALNKYYSSKLNGIIILGGENCVTVYENLNVNCNDVYVYYLNLGIQPYDEVTVHYENGFSLCGIDFEFADGYSLSADCYGVNLGICGGANPFFALRFADFRTRKHDLQKCVHGIF